MKEESETEGTTDMPETMWPEDVEVPEDV